MGLTLTGFENILALLWNDRMDITTTEEISDVADDAVYPEEPQQVDVPCRISMPNLDKVENANELREPVELRPRIFCSPSIQVRPGDRITVRRCHSDGEVYATFTGLASTAGKANVWENHQEFELVMEGDA